MSSFPLEIKALIVHELAHDQKTLSTVSYVWPETIPYIREHRFKNLKFESSKSLARLLPVITGTPALGQIIRSIFFISMSSPSDLADFKLPLDVYINFVVLLMMAPKLEEVSVDEADISKFNYVLAAIPSSLYPLITLKKFGMHFSSPSLAALLDIIRVFSHLTTFTLCHVIISDLCPIAGQIWDLVADPSQFDPERCVMWDTHNFEVPKLVPQVISINLYFSYVSDLMFLDLLASPKTPFPNIEEITFVDNELSMCRPRRLQALLDRYKTTLRVLNLTCNSDSKSLICSLSLPDTIPLRSTRPHIAPDFGALQVRSK